MTRMSELISGVSLRWLLAIAMTLNVVLLASLFVMLAPSLTDPLTRPVLSFLTAAADQGERTYSTSGIDDPKQTVQEQTVTENREPYLPFLTTGFVGGRQRQIEPNYQFLSSLDRAASVAKMALSTGQVRFRQKGSDKIFHCSGTLISDKYILTAAHCFFYNVDSDAGDFVRRAEITDIRFDLGPIDGEHPAEVILGVNPRPREIVCPRHYVGKDCVKGPTDGYDFAILEIWPDAEQDKYRNTLLPELPKASNWTMQQARNLGYRPARLADVPIISRHQMMLSHFPAISSHMVTERHCQGIEKPVSAEQDLIKHVCDTQGGSSGGSVFSRDHEAMIAMHIRGSKIFNERERQAGIEANHALLITAIARVSKIIGREVEVLDHPPTTEQQAAIDYANKRGEEAERLAAQGRHTAATYVALDGLERFVGRKDDEDYLFSHAAPAQGALINAVDEQKELMQLKHEGSVSSAAFSPDGKLLVTASGKTARIWDVRTGRELGERRLVGHDDHINSAVFSHRDGKLIVTASADGTARLWDAQTGKELKERRLVANTAVWSAIFSPDNSLIVTTYDETVAMVSARLWNVRTGVEIKPRQLVGHSRRVVGADFSPDGKLIVTAGFDDGARLWDASNGQEIKDQFVGGDESVRSAVFSPDGKLILTASSDGTARVWDARTGKEIKERRLVGQGDSLNRATFSHDSSFIVTASGGIAVRLWDMRSAQPIEVGRFGGHEGPVFSATFNQDGSLIATASYDGSARIWLAPTGRRMLARRLMRHDERSDAAPDEGVSSAAFSYDGKLIVTAGVVDGAQIWDAATGQEIKARRIEHNEPFNSVAFSPNGDVIITASWDGTARLWDARTGEENKERRLVGHDKDVTSAEFNPDGDVIVTASKDKTARLWDAYTGQEIKARRLVGHNDTVSRAVFSPDGNYIVTVSLDKTARLWDVRTGKEVEKRRLIGHENYVTSAAFSRDGKLIGTGGGDRSAYDNILGNFPSARGDARLWEVQTGKEFRARRLFGHTSAVTSIAFNPADTLIITASRDNSTRIWDVRSGQEIRTRRLAGHQGNVTSATFSPDPRGKLILTASENEARIIETPATDRALINQAYCRIRKVKPSAAECSNLGLNCDLPRVPADKCDELVPSMSSVN